jgi:hypothetical protein
MRRVFGHYDTQNLGGFGRYAADVFADVFASGAFFEKAIVLWKPRLDLRPVAARAAGDRNVGDAAKISGEHLNNNIIGDASARAGSIGIRTASFVERALS